MPLPPALTVPPVGRELPVVMHVPHASRAIPPLERGALGLDDAQLRAELDRVTDDLLDQACLMAPHLGITLLAHRVSRLVVDPCLPRADALPHRPAGQEPRPGQALSPGARERRLVDWYDPYAAALRQAVATAVDRYGTCLLLEAGTFVSDGPPRTDEFDACRVRLGAVEGHEPTWLQVHWREHASEKVLEFFTIAPSDAGARWHELRAEFGDQLAFVRMELDQHTYLDLDDGRHFASWRDGADLLHYLLAQAADIVDERTGYRRREMTREEARLYAVDQRTISGELPPVRRVVAWNELEDKPPLGRLRTGDANDCWVVLYEHSPQVSPGTHAFSMFHRITGAPEFIGVRYDEP